MRVPRIRFTIGRLMVVVALACITLGAARVHVLLGFYAGGSSILALDRLFYRLDLRRDEQRPLTTLQAACLMFGSAAAGAITVLIAVAVFEGICLVVYVWARPGPETELGTLFRLTVPALFFAAWTGSVLRHAFRGPAPAIREGAVADPPPPD